MPLFYVYMNWFDQDTSHHAGLGRQLLTCESRHVADEFFRALQAATHCGQKRFTLLERRTPQLWYYDSIDGDAWYTVLHVLRSSAFQQFGQKVMSQLLSDATGRDWPVIPLVDGPDWVNNGTYFIRNKRQPELYWYHHDGYIYISRMQKTKFRVRGVDFEKSDKKVLIRSDRVHISVVGQGAKSPIYLAKESSSNKVTVAWDGRVWKFGDFIDGFGCTVEDNEGMVQEFITWASEDDGDEWELC